jgi:glycerophosphoryl diester phosphodiesterase
MLQRFVPQLFHFEEYDPIKPIGFPKLILSLYAMDASDDDVLQWVQAHPVHAVTMPAERAKASDLAKKLGDAGVPVYAHTVNDKADLDALIVAGVDGVYTDTLLPKDLAAPK